MLEPQKTQSLINKWKFRCVVNGGSNLSVIFLLLLLLYPQRRLPTVHITRLTLEGEQHRHKIKDCKCKFEKKNKHQCNVNVTYKYRDPESVFKWVAWASIKKYKTIKKARRDIIIIPQKKNSNKMELNCE